MLINALVRQVCLWCMLPSSNIYTSHLQDATTVELAIKMLLLVCQLKIIRVLQHSN